MSSASWFRRRTFLKVFTIYGLESQLGLVTLSIWTNLHPNIPWRLHRKIGFKRPKCFFEEKKFENAESECQWMALTLGCHVLIYLYQLSPHKHGITQAPNAAYQLSRSSTLWFQRRFLRLLPYMGMAAILVMWPGVWSLLDMRWPDRARYRGLHVNLKMSQFADPDLPG